MERENKQAETALEKKPTRRWLVPLIICGTVAAILVGAFAFTLLAFLGAFDSGSVKNRPDSETGLTVADGFRLYSGDDIGYAFQYPATCTTGWDEKDGTYLYQGEIGGAPYVLVSRTNQHSMNPEKYFKACDRMLLERFKDLQSTSIQQAKVGDKTLYLVRYVSKNLVIDRYLELYDNFYLEYTAVSNEKDSLNTELYYTITTLRLQEGAYRGAYSEEVSLHQAEDLGLSIEIPDMLDTKELTIGYFSTSDDVLLLAVWIDKDDTGKAIYNRQDFIDRAAQSPGFVAGLLGADSASFTQGSEESYGDTSFYCYPMVLSSGGDAFTGKLCLANAKESGCWLISFAVRDGCPMGEQSLALMQECASSIEID